MAKPSFWDNQERAQATVEERKSLSAIIAPLESALKASDDLSAMIEMAAEDDSFALEVPSEVERLEGVIEALVAAAHGSPEAADPAIALLESNFEERGVDALYDIATGKANPQLRAKAAKSLEKSDVRDEASKATLFLLDFRATKACEAKRELLSRARDDGDARAYAVVKTLAEGKGCGFLNLSDCYHCMRTKDAAKELKETLAKLEDRKK